jgi:hypothetical protein
MLAMPAIQHNVVDNRTCTLVRVRASSAVPPYEVRRKQFLTSMGGAGGSIAYGGGCPPSHPPPPNGHRHDPLQDYRLRTRPRCGLAYRRGDPAPGHRVLLAPPLAASTTIAAACCCYHGRRRLLAPAPAASWCCSPMRCTSTFGKKAEKGLCGESERDRDRGSWVSVAGPHS